MSTAAVVEVELYLGWRALFAGLRTLQRPLALVAAGIAILVRATRRT